MDVTNSDYLVCFNGLPLPTPPTPPTSTPTACFYFYFFPEGLLPASCANFGKLLKQFSFRFIALFRCNHENSTMCCL